MTVKEEWATKKLLMPLRTGICCFRRNGASIGSLATQSSITTNAQRDITANASGKTTPGASHWQRLSVSSRGTYWFSAHRLLVAEPCTQEYKKRGDLI